MPITKPYSIRVTFLYFIYLDKCNSMCLQDPSHATFKEKMKEFMASFDKNSDGRIEMSEVRTIYFLTNFLSSLIHPLLFPVCLHCERQLFI